MAIKNTGELRRKFGSRSRIAESPKYFVSAHYLGRLIISTTETNGSLMTTIRFRPYNSKPTADELRKIRHFTDLGISEIRRRAESRQSILEFVAFDGNWQTNRALLVQIAQEMANGTLPFSAVEVVSGVEKDIDIQQLRERLRHLRSIELETQMHTMLELGEIESPEEFEPYDNDWTEV